MDIVSVLANVVVLTMKVYKTSTKIKNIFSISDSIEINPFYLSTNVRYFKLEMIKAKGLRYLGTLCLLLGDLPYSRVCMYCEYLPCSFKCLREACRLYVLPSQVQQYLDVITRLPTKN